MNELSHPSPGRPTTQAAEGLPRWRWTTDELVRLTELGAFTAEDRFELIGGEIVPISPSGRRHEVLASLIEDSLRALAPADIRIRTERQHNLSDDTYTKPDIFVHEAAILPPDVRGDTVLLVIEVADTSFDFDTGTKAALYASHGVREYWVVNARTLETRVHRKPGEQGYADVSICRADQTLASVLVPALTVHVGDLKLD